MRSVNMDQDQFQLGQTKVFVKAPESVRLAVAHHLSFATKTSIYLAVGVDCSENRRKK